MTSWSIRVSSDFKTWLKELTKNDPAAAAAVNAAVTELAHVGPGLGRPLVDTIEGSKHKNMKELRPRSGQQVAIRVLFCLRPGAAWRAPRWRQQGRQLA